MISNAIVLTVSEISQGLKNAVENQFGYVHVRGELTEVKRAASGHIYATLKDKDAVLNLIIWRTSAERLKIKPEDGLEVIATGKMTIYPGRSNYQLVADQLEVAGQGALLKLIEERRKKLAAEGLFDDNRKRPLPRFPLRIAVVTSPTGAVIRDILHRLAERYPCQVDLWPVLVQGDGAASQITGALLTLNALSQNERPDLVIVARGGGSLEDLMAFNDEAVVRAAAASSVPLISAVGHETDTTLIDWAADKRAPTPTAAAEMATPERAALLDALMDIQSRLQRCLVRYEENNAQKLDQTVFRLSSAISQIIERKASIITALKPRSPLQILGHQYQNIVMLGQRLHQAISRRIERLEGSLATLRIQAPPLDKTEMKLDALTRLLQASSFEATLERGFVLIRDENDKAITNPQNLSTHQKVQLQFAGQKTRKAEIL